MPSPFPGMDPWLEGPYFGDLHSSLITYVREALNSAMPPGYTARGTYLVWMDDELRREPDVGAYGPDLAPGGTAVAALPGLAALGTRRAPEPREQVYLEIRGNQGERLVTAVEILSRSNKRPGGAGRKAYEDKQEEFRLGGVNLVEIDLLRAGAHTTAVPLARLRRRAGAFDYHVCVTVAGTPDRLHAAAFHLADRLPAFGIPLDPGVAPVVVDLQPMLDRAYDTGRYAQVVNYRRDPDPPLTAEQKAWADAILKEKGLLP
jgi:hypothetical protein